MGHPGCRNISINLRNKSEVLAHEGTTKGTSKGPTTASPLAATLLDSKLT